MSTGMKKITVTERKVKDFNFMLDTPKEQISPGIIKRVDVQGRGQVIGDIKVPCNIYISYYKYDYEGKFMSQILNLSVRNFNQKASVQIPPGLLVAISSMKLDQKSWYNFKYFQLHQTQKALHGGCHFYISIDDLKYKNSQSLQSKKLVSEECRKQAKALFEKGDYEQAMKRYRKEINITQGIDKKKFSVQQLSQITQINQKAKKNFLRCFNRLTNIDDASTELAETYSKQLLKNKREDITIFLRANVLIQRKYLTNALQLANQLVARGNKEGQALVTKIEQKMSEKK